MGIYLPSIFNDVVGPVMRGPSSSHSAAALRIGRLCRDLMNGDPGQVVVQYNRQDALATTHRSQGSDMGMMGGLLGYEPDDPRLLHVEEHVQASEVNVRFEITHTGYNHPNVYLVHLRSKTDTKKVVALSTGGGMVEVLEIDGVAVSIMGDYYEVLIYTENQKSLFSQLEREAWMEQMKFHKGTHSFVEVKATRPPPKDWISQLKARNGVNSVCVLDPVLPILSSEGVKVPFTNEDQMKQYGERRNLKGWEVAAEYEAIRGGITRKEVIQKMSTLYEIMRESVLEGLKGTSYKDRILGVQSAGYRKSLLEGKLAGGDALHNITLYVTALMEVKSSLGTIVAAPTAGSCATFPGAVLGVADSLGVAEEEVIHAFLTGSLVGLFIAYNSTFSAEIGGCQAECGSGAGMAAASIACLLGGDLATSMGAASLAIQNSLGMICDPIAARVEAPCLGKNVNSALNALASANMAMAGYDPLIPLDQVIETMDRVGKSLPMELRCSALGGLAMTPAAKRIENRLKG